MIDENFKKLPKWEQFMTLPAKRQANGKLILRGVGTSKALHEIKPGEEIAIAVFKNDENYLIAVSFRERDNTFEQARSYSENNPNFDT